MPVRDLKAPLTSWVATGGASATIDEQGRLVFNDGTQGGQRILRLTDASLNGAMVRVSLVARPTPECTTQLLVLHPDAGFIVCRVSPSGQVIDAGVATELSVQRQADGALAISATYFSTVGAAGLGAGALPASSPGTGKPQFIFDSIEGAAGPAEMPDADRRIVVLDAGSDWRFAPQWRRLCPRVVPVAVPRPTGSFPLLRQDVASYPGGRMLDAVLYNKKGRRKLNRAAEPARSSLLAVDRRTLRKFADSAPFEVQEQINADCVRYDELHAAGTAPAPDALRLDTQGTEYEVLQGFGNLLEGCLAVQVRSALYPVYKGQKLLTDIADLLDKRDFVMSGLGPMPQGGQVVEVQAWFVKSAEWAAAQPDVVRERLAAISRLPGFGG